MPFFSYNRDIPFASNNPSDDQPDMQTNTNSIDDLIEVDHFSFEDANGGYHQKSTYVAGGNPGSVSGAAQIFAKAVTYTGGDIDTELFMKKASNDINDPNGVIQLTDTKFGASASNSGYSWLPGGIIIQWGRSTSTFDPTVGAGFAVSFPNVFPNSVFTCTFSVTKNSTTAHSCFFRQAPTTSGFVLRGDTTFDGYFYIAIGR